MTAELWLHKPHPDKAEHVGCCVTLDPEQVVRYSTIPGYTVTVKDIIDVLTEEE